MISDSTFLRVKYFWNFVFISFLPAIVHYSVLIDCVFLIMNALWIDGDGLKTIFGTFTTSWIVRLQVMPVTRSTQCSVVWKKLSNEFNKWWDRLRIFTSQWLNDNDKLRCPLVGYQCDLEELYAIGWMRTIVLISAHLKECRGIILKCHSWRFLYFTDFYVAIPKNPESTKNKNGA